MTERADSDQVAIPDDERIKVLKAYESIYTYEEKRSKFICHLFPVVTEEDVSISIASIRKRYHDASHNCYAYMLFNDGIILRKSSDDGEPKGTAGLPMLKVLEANMIYDTLLIVTRYFGGVLLGTGGLARAYAKTASEGIALSEKVRLVESCLIHMVLSYHDYKKVENLLRENDIVLDEIDFFDRVEIRFYIPSYSVSDIVKKAADKTDGRALINIGDSMMREVTL